MRSVSASLPNEARFSFNPINASSRLGEGTMTTDKSNQISKVGRLSTTEAEDFQATSLIK